MPPALPAATGSAAVSSDTGVPCSSAGSAAAIKVSDTALKSISPFFAFSARFFALSAKSSDLAERLVKPATCSPMPDAQSGANSLTSFAI